MQRQVEARHYTPPSEILPLVVDETPQVRSQQLRMQQAIRRSDRVVAEMGTLLDVPSSFTRKQPHGSENRIQSVIDSDLQEIHGIQQQFDAALGRSYDADDLLHRSYNPVIDVFHLRKLRRNGNTEGEQGYLNEISINMATNLRERYQTSVSTINYRIEDGDVYSQHFPLESFDKVLARGVEYRLQHNTPEPEREGMLGEQAGWQKIQEKFTDPKTEVGYTMTTFSPPGLAENTAYKGKFIDEYELARNELGEKYIKLTRYAVNFTEAEFDAAALSLDPNFFDGFDGRPKDAWMLSHPVEGCFGYGIPDDKIAKEEDFVPDITTGKLKLYLDNFKRVLQKVPPDYMEIAISFNAFLNLADEEHDAWKNGKMLPSTYDMPVSRAAIQKEIDEKGRQEVRTVVGGGCPANKGIQIQVGLNGGESILSNEAGVSQFSASNPGERTLRCKTCPICHAGPIIAKISNGRITHPEKGCSAPYVC